MMNQVGIVEELYRSPIPDDMNVRFVENHIVIGRPARVVYDWVTTWSNLPKWLPVAHRTDVVKGRAGMPALFGDQLLEQVNVNHSPKHYTVVARIPGSLWTVAGQDAPNDLPDGRISWVATFMTIALSDRATLFCRQFQSIRAQSDLSRERYAVEDPQIIQESLHRLKEKVELELTPG